MDRDKEDRTIVGIRLLSIRRARVENDERGEDSEETFGVGAGVVEQIEPTREAAKGFKLKEEEKQGV